MRFDSRLANDAEFLAEQLGRSQNELVNIGLEELIRRHSWYFLGFLLVDGIRLELEQDEESAEAGIENIKIIVRWVSETDSFVVTYLVFDDKKEVESAEEREYLNTQDMESGIHFFARKHLDRNDPLIMEALNDRLSYK